VPLSYLSYGVAVFIFYPVTWICLLLDMPWALLAPLSILATHLLFDNLTSPALSEETRGAELGNALLWLHGPWAVITLVLMLWRVAPGDLAGIGAAAEPLLGDWLASGPASIGELLLVAYVGGFMLSTNTIAAHELVHRRSSPLSIAFGRFLLAINGDAQFSISHVYGHHMRVATPDDPATARRGENLYRFALRSAIGQYVEAWELEAARLKRVGQPVWSIHHALLRSLLGTALIAILCYAVAGGRGVLVFFVAALTSKFLFECVNYVQHYGLLRVLGSKVEPRHSWDCASRAATFAFYNLTRHSHHHAKPVSPFWELKPNGHSGAPQLDRGYIAAMLLACIPPLWFRWTTPRLLAWDARLASDAERRLAADANRASGYPPLMAAASA
jgi:hypothetical protein